MKQIILLGILLLCAAIVAGCSVFGIGQRLRIKNDSAMPITNLRVLFPDQEISFGTVPAYTTTTYQIFSKGVYGYAAYKYDWNGQTITQPVMDWVGEKPMDGSAFTYTIQFNPNQVQSLAIQLTNVTRDQ